MPGTPVRITNINNFGHRIKMQSREVSAREMSCLIQQIFVEAGRRIDNAIAIGQPLQITKLSKDLAEQFSIKNQVEMYHLLRLFVSSQPDIKAKQGPKGGIVKVSSKE